MALIITSLDWHSISIIVYKLLTKCCKLTWRYNSSTAIHVLLCASNDVHCISQSINLCALSKRSQHLQTAIHIFNSTIAHEHDNIVIIGAMLKCYIEHGCYDDAIHLFEHIHATQSVHNDVSLLLYIKACIHSRCHQKAVDMIEQYITLHSTQHQHSIPLLNCIIDFYGVYCDNAMEKAVAVFESIPNRHQHINTINSMMKCLLHNQRYADAMRLYTETKQATPEVAANGIAEVAANRQWQNALHLFDDIQPLQRDIYFYIIALNVCADSLSLDEGLRIISDLNGTDFAQHIDVQCAIIRFYTKTQQTQAVVQCLAGVQQSGLLQKDKRGALHTAMIDCYAKMGEMDKALQLFRIVKDEKQIKISPQMHSAVINACSHAGLLEEAIAIFDEIKTGQISPSVVVAMIDCFGRTQNLRQSEKLFKQFQQRLDPKSKLIAIKSILSSCRTYNNLQTAQRVFSELCGAEYDTSLHLVDDLNAVHTLMSNILAQNGEYDQANFLRSKIKQ